MVKMLDGTIEDEVKEVATNPHVSLLVTNYPLLQTIATC